MKWSEAIKDCRRRLSLTQADLGARLGVTQATVARWEQGYFAPSGEIRNTIEHLIDNARIEKEVIHCARVVNNINPNLIFTRAGEYIVMSPSAQQMLNDLHADAGAFAQEHQGTHYAVCMRAAVEAGFFEGRISHMRILRPWLRGQDEVIGVIDIVWTPIVLANAEIVIESNFKTSPRPSETLGFGQFVRLTSTEEAPRDRLRPSLVPHACGGRTVPAASLAA